jgi:hypothetical protein
LNKELHRASSAFLAGFRRLIDEKWLRMLSEGELQQAGERLGDVLSIWINVGKTICLKPAMWEW